MKPRFNKEEEGKGPKLATHTLNLGNRSRPNCVSTALSEHLVKTGETPLLWHLLTFDYVLLSSADLLRELVRLINVDNTSPA